MNKARYDNLPDDLKKIIDDNSGAALAAKAGELWNSFEAPGEMQAEPTARSSSERRRDGGIRQAQSAGGRPLDQEAGRTASTARLWSTRQRRRFSALAITG
jgi:hypothetical protein